MEFLNNLQIDFTAMKMVVCYPDKTSEYEADAGCHNPYSCPMRKPPADSLLYHAKAAAPCDVAAFAYVSSSCFVMGIITS